MCIFSWIRIRDVGNCYITLLEGMKNRDGQEHDNSSTKLLHIGTAVGCAILLSVIHTSIDLFGQYDDFRQVPSISVSSNMMEQR